MMAGLVCGATVLAATVLAACGGSSGASNPGPLLVKAKSTIDGTQALHFDLTSQGVSGSGTTITGGSGDIGRPDQIRGSFQLTVGGFKVTVKVLAAQSKFYAEAPFQSSYVLTNPATYGVGNPALLIDPNTGLSSLLTAIQNPKSGGQTRRNGEVLDQITGSVPGSKVPVLPDTRPADPVQVTALVNPSSHQVRQIVLTGPFTSSTPSTFTVTLTNYGEAVHVALPG